MKRRLYVLIACEESQAECTAFRELGHVAFSCDVQPCRKGGHPEWHINADVVPYLQGKHTFVNQAGTRCSVPRWDLIIAHPPCTYLCKVSAVQMAKDADTSIIFRGKQKLVNGARLRKLVKARKFFLLCLNARARYVAVENPLPMAIAQLPPASCYACPSWYGFKYTKKTLYWLKNLPPLMAGFQSGSNKSLVEHSRGKYRSRTYPGLAKAIAEQWSDYILNDKFV